VSANTAETENKRISDADMLARASVILLIFPTGIHAEKSSTEIPTFLLAGHETSSTTLSWILFELSIHPVLQTRLRTELRSLLLPDSSSISPPLDADVLSALEKLPLLDAVVRETLRLHAPVRVTLRMATKETVLPLSVPVVDKNGVARSALELREGDLVFMPIYLVNRLKEVYGEDADEWRCVLLAFSVDPRA
jgi:cytochrome P450